MLTLVFDTETTGLPAHPAAKVEVQPRIIEWGGALVNEHGDVIDRLNMLIDPGEPITDEITKITGITTADVQGQPRFGAAASCIRPFFSRAQRLIAHNLPFDRYLMELDLQRCGLLAGWPWPAQNVCTVQEHFEEFGRRPKLTELYEHYMGKPLAQTHRAIEDVLALVQVCKAAGVLKP